MASVAALAALLRAGQHEVLADWYRAEHAGVYRLCFGLLRHEADAEDAAQDAMLHLYDQLSRWNPERAYGPWRQRVVVNLCRDRMRRQGARRRAEEAPRLLGADVPEPAVVVQQDETQELLRQALGLLPPREREVFVLRELEGESVGDVAEALGIGSSTVRSLATLARRRLRERLAPRLGLEEARPERGGAS